jgi:enamine deaminase RidA (YjgF/YER057c/UK114 family)
VILYHNRQAAALACGGAISEDCRDLQNEPAKLTVGQECGLNVGRSAAMPMPRESLVLQENIMAGAIEKKLTELGITISTPAAPVANYVGYVRTGNLLVVSGQICLGSDGKLVAAGKLGAGVSIDDGQKAARACAINLLAQLKAALGDLDKVVRVVRLGGFINSAPTFLDGPKVMNGASDLMVAVFGDKGRHARTTVGVAALPLDAAVEVEGMFEVS